MGTEKHPKRKRLLFTALLCVLMALFLEAFSGLVLQVLPAPDTRSRDWRAIYAASGLFDSSVDLDLFYEEQRAVWSNVSFDFYRYYRPQPNFEGQYYNTNADGFRPTRQHTKAAAAPSKTILFFGGSTMWGIGSAGEASTIPSQFARLINDEHEATNYVVKNYAVGGYHNAQELIVLLEKLGTEDIDYVIFYDWVNEAAMGYRELMDRSWNGPFLQPSVNVGIPGVVRFLEERGYDLRPKGGLETLNRSRFIRLLLTVKERTFSEKAKAPSELEGEGVETGLSERERRQAERIVALYGRNKKIIEALEEPFGFDAFFIMQPSLFTKRALSPYEAKSPHWDDRKSMLFERYVCDLANEAFSGDPSFVDLRDAIDTEDTIYLDDHHTTERGNRIIAAALLEALKDLVADVGARV